VAPLFDQAVRILFPVVIEAFDAQLSLSITATKRAITDLKDSQKPSIVFAELQESLNVLPLMKKLPARNASLWQSKVSELLAIVDKLDNSSGIADSIRKEINQVIKPVPNTLYPHTIEESMARLAKNTAFTFQADFAERELPEDCGKDTLAKLNHDLAYSFQQIARTVLKELVRKPLEDYVRRHVAVCFFFFLFFFLSPILRYCSPVSPPSSLADPGFTSLHYGPGEHRQASLL